VRDALLDTPPAIELALDWLLQQPDVDPARAELVGVSLGSIFACIAGARDPRWTRVWVLHGAAQPERLVEAGLERKGYWSPIRWAVARAAYVAACGPHLAPEHWIGSIAPRPVVLVNAADDERMPRDAVLALHAAAREPKEVVWLPGQHIEPKRTEIVRALVDLVLDRVTGEAQR
jgi:dienelactone hydrolase